MFIVIKVHHIALPEYQYFASKEDFETEVKLTTPAKIEGFDEAWEYYTHDLHAAVSIEKKKDLEEALQYPQGKHRWADIRALARQIKQEYASEFRRSPGRKSIPDEQKNKKVMVTLPPAIAEYLRQKDNSSAYVAELITEKMKHESN